MDILIYLGIIFYNMVQTVEGKHHAQHKPKPPAREKQKIWEADQDVDMEDITFVVPIVISAVLLLVFFLRMYIRWTVNCPSSNRLDGKTVLITGGNTGIGRATALELSRRGAKVILGCRDHARGEAVARLLKTKTNNQDVHAYKLDLGSMTSIKEFVDDFNQKEPSLHVLINNAAYMGPRATTDDGLERSFGVNYLGHFYLTYLLKDKMKRTAPSRIINVISDSYKKAKLDFDDLAFQNYDMYKAYARSKLAQMIFSVECHRRFYSDAVYTFGVHPGCVSTELMRNWSGFTGNLLRTVGRVMFKSPEEGCQTVVFLAVADHIREQSGRFFENCQLFKVKEYIKDKEMGKKLWDISLNLCGLEEERDREFVSTENQETNHVTQNGVEDVGDVSQEEKKNK